MARFEDRRLLTGQGRFVDDLDLEGSAHAAMVRAPHPSARIASIDARAARAMPGVLAVWIADDLDRAGLGTLPCRTPVESRDGAPMTYPPRPLIAGRDVRYAGETVAAVVAETAAEARDAAERVEVEYEERAACTDVARASERCFDWEVGDAAAVDAAFARAERIVSIELRNNRVAVAPIETRGALAVHEPDGGDGRFTLYTQSQGVHLLRSVFAEDVLGIAPERLRVVTGDVGGSFGMKIMAYPEQGIVLFAARELGRPVKWIGERADAFLTDNQARDHWQHAEIALDAEGRFLAVRGHVRANLGAYLSTVAAMVPTEGMVRVYGHVYDVPALYLRVEGMLTNTTPVDAYRGAGKPELITLVERLVDRAGRETGLGPVEIRRRNLIRPDAMPYTTAIGKTWDCGDFPAVLDRALERADWDGFAGRAERSRRDGLLRGRGLGMTLHASGGSTAETATVRIGADGVVEVLSGTQSGGQGHETVYARLVAERLEVDPEAIRVVQGDSDVIAAGGGTGGSSSMTIAAPAIDRASARFLDAARMRAAERLESAAADLEYGAGRFRVAGTDVEIALSELAPGDADAPPACVGEAAYEGQPMTVPNGCYVAEVEIDPDTGQVRLVAFTTVDDVGRAMDAAIVGGQIHGGVAQAIGQALLEHVVYDEDSGQLLSGSLMDYALPRAEDLPSFRGERLDVPSVNNPLGFKGVGELGTIGGCAAVMNAVADAIGDDAIDMPATPLAVWRALAAAVRS